MGKLDNVNEVLSEAVDLLAEKKPFSRKVGDDLYKLDKLGYVGRWRKIARHNAFLTTTKPPKVLFLPGMKVVPMKKEQPKESPRAEKGKKGIFAKIRNALAAHMAKKRK